MSLCLVCSSLDAFRAYHIKPSDLNAVLDDLSESLILTGHARL